MLGDDRLAAAPAVDERDRRDRAADEAALPARRRVDELLELRPAVRLVEDALADDVGERVDGDPVARLAGGPADELPGPLRLVGDQSARAVPKANQRGSSSRLAEEAVGDEEPRARAIAAGRLAEAALDGLDQRPADADDGADPGRDPALALEVLRVGERPRGRCAGRRRTRPGRRSARRGRRRAPRPRRVWSATNAMARSVVGLVAALAHGRAARRRRRRRRRPPSGGSRSAA